MGWATRYIEKLRAGESVSFRPRGQSMTGRIESGQLCTVVPVDPDTLCVGDIVLCKVAGNEYFISSKRLAADASRLETIAGSSMGGLGRTRSSESACKSRVDQLIRSMLCSRHVADRQRALRIREG